jgi:hypothetical protein
VEVRGLRCRLLIGVINNCERANAMANDLLWGVVGVDSAMLHDLGGSTRVRKPCSSNIEGHEGRNFGWKPDY